MRKSAEQTLKKYGLGIVDLSQSLEQYDFFLEKFPKQPKIKSLVSNALNKNGVAKILDLGCGSAQALNELKQLLGKKVFTTGIDLIKPKFSTDLFFEGDAFELQFPSNADLLFSFRAMHEIGELEKVFEKICNCLSFSGKAFLSIRLFNESNCEKKWHGLMGEKEFNFLKKILAAKKFGKCLVEGNFLKLNSGNSIEAGFNIVLKKLND